MENKKIGKPHYGLIDNAPFGVRIVSGIVTGISYTEKEPIYEISFGKSKWRTTEIFTNLENLQTLLKIKSLEEVKKSHGLKIKYSL